MQQNEVVDVADVMPAAQDVLDVLVKHVEIDIGEELAAEVADGQSEVRRVAGQALMQRNALQRRRVAA